MNEQEYNKSVGNYLSKLRKLEGLSQRDLSEKTGISRTAISDVEKGSRLPSTRDLLALCRIYQVTPNQVLSFGGDESSFTQSLSDEDQLKRDLMLLSKAFFSFYRLSRQSKKTVSDIVLTMAAGENGMAFLDEMESVEESINALLDDPKSQGVINDILQRSENGQPQIDDAFLYLVNVMMHGHINQHQEQKAKP